MIKTISKYKMYYLYSAIILFFFLTFPFFFNIYLYINLFTIFTLFLMRKKRNYYYIHIYEVIRAYIIYLPIHIFIFKYILYIPQFDIFIKLISIFLFSIAILNLFNLSKIKKASSTLNIFWQSFILLFFSTIISFIPIIVSIILTIFFLIIFYLSDYTKKRRINETRKILKQANR